MTSYIHHGITTCCLQQYKFTDLREMKLYHGCRAVLQSGKVLSAAKVAIGKLYHHTAGVYNVSRINAVCQLLCLLLYGMFVRPISAVSGASRRRKLLPPGFWVGLRRRPRGVTPGLRRLPRGLATGLRRPSALSLSGLMRGVDMFSMSCSASTAHTDVATTCFTQANSHDTSA